MKIKANKSNWELLGLNIIVRSMITALDMLKMLKEKPALKKDCI